MKVRTPEQNLPVENSPLADYTYCRHKVYQEVQVILAERCPLIISDGACYLDLSSPTRETAPVVAMTPASFKRFVATVRHFSVDSRYQLRSVNSVSACPLLFAPTQKAESL